MAICRPGCARRPDNKVASPVRFGAYDAGSHGLYLVAGNHATLAEAETTLLHELIGHHGLNQLAVAEGRMAAPTSWTCSPPWVASLPC